MNETLNVIAKRFSCRDFNNKDISNENLELIAQAALQSPSGMNRQHWQIIVIKNKTLLSEMDIEGMKVLSSMQDKTLYQKIMARGGKLFYNAPCMILLAVKEAYPKGAELIDLGILAQNIVLAATSLDIATLHCGFVGLAFAGNKAAEFKSRLKFIDGYECGLGILLGYANTVAPPHSLDKSKITIIE